MVAGKEKIKDPHCALFGIKPELENIISDIFRVRISQPPPELLQKTFVKKELPPAPDAQRVDEFFCGYAP
jgi:hypothetical protein